MKQKKKMELWRRALMRKSLFKLLSKRHNKSHLRVLLGLCGEEEIKERERIAREAYEKRWREVYYVVEKKINDQVVERRIYRHDDHQLVSRQGV